MIADKARELDELRERRAQLRAELATIDTFIRKLTDEMIADIHDNPVRNERQQQILAMVRAQKSNKEIAWALHVSEPTVKWHVANLFKKYGVTDRRDL